MNNAGITHRGSIVNTSIKDIQKYNLRIRASKMNSPLTICCRILDVNLLSHFFLSKAVLPRMLAANRGYIVTIASCLGYQSPINYGV